MFLGLWVFVAGPAASDSILDAAFDSGRDGFSYSDDVFHGTNAPDHAHGSGPDGTAGSIGVLTVGLGNHDSELVEGMSGGWSRTFELERMTFDLRIRFRYQMIQESGYERDEFSQVMVSLDGKPLQGMGPDFVERLVGDGDGGEVQTTGWREFSSNEGLVSAGRHTLRIGGYGNKKTAFDESTTILIDDVRVTGTPEPRCWRDAECNDENPCTDDVCVANRCQHRGNTGSCPDGFDYGE